ncbi:MAG: ABC transporter ATP-binding protein [Clostridia bacterium]|nr:ABC transporter ATP-binding protein [Clostridia bacterium]
MSEENQETVLEIKNLCKEYKMYKRKKDRLLEIILPHYQKHSTFTALQDFNLELKKGEILGILGRNGAGKSTLLKMITGVVVPTSGEINMKGKISSLLELGTAFNPELTGYENIYQHGQIMGLTKEKVKEKEKEIIEFADIGEHLYQPVKTYSSGMFARLAFACAINVDPDILIVDEVLSVGDMAFQLKCFKKFEQFKKKGKTILFVTHSISDVLNNCNRAIILQSGKKIFDGDVKAGVEEYKKLITKMRESDGTAGKNKITKEVLNSIDEKAEWKEHFTVNPDMTVYGNNEANVYDYGIFDKDNQPLPIVDNNEETHIKLKVQFNTDVENPFVSITIKDFHGKEMCGNNTNFMGIETGICKAEEEYIFDFEQKLRLAPGKYTLSVSCNRFDENGELIVMNRNYDALIFEVTSQRKMVGCFDMDPTVEFRKIERG